MRTRIALAALAFVSSISFAAAPTQAEKEAAIKAFLDSTVDRGMSALVAIYDMGYAKAASSASLPNPAILNSPLFGMQPMPLLDELTQSEQELTTQKLLIDNQLRRVWTTKDYLYNFTQETAKLRALLLAP